MSEAVVVTLLQFILLLLKRSYCDAFCQACYVTRLGEFDNRLVTTSEIWSPNVTNQGACSRKCLTDERCVIFQHNKDTGRCGGLASKFTSLSEVESVSETGNRLFLPCTAAHRYGGACKSGSDCHVTKTDCIDGVCQCQVGYFLSLKSYRCLYPAYVGCYEDHPTRMLPNAVLSTSSMRTLLCIEHCMTKGYIYAATQYRTWCFCGNILPDGYRKRSDSECNLQCEGDSTQMCGGEFRNSVYLTSL